VYGGVELELDTFLTTLVDGDIQPASCIRSCTLGERAPSALQTGGRGAPKVVWTFFREKSRLLLAGIGPRFYIFHAVAVTTVHAKLDKIFAVC